MTYKERLEQQKSKGLYRSLTLSNPDFVDLQSNDYLGYAAMMKESKIPFAHKTSGATGSRLISGNTSSHEQAEVVLSQYFNTQSSLLFSSGYQANLGLLSCIAHRGDTFIYDEHIHASMHDGMRLSHAYRFSFRHNDLQDLEEKLIKHQNSGRIIVAMESLYSMTGTLIDVNKILELDRKYNFTLVLDEAHAVGVSGHDFKGLATEKAAQFKDLIRVITFGKAFGYAGAAVLCSEEMREYLINFSRPFIYTTAMPVNDAEMIESLIQFHRDSKASNISLNEIINYYLSKISSLNSPKNITQNSGPIQFITIGENEATLNLEKTLQKNKLQVKAIRPPTVPQGHAGIRISLHAYNTPSEIDTLFAALKTFNQISNY